VRHRNAELPPHRTLASRDVTVVEIDFANPANSPDHCPPHSTFVHRLAGGRSQRLDIHYV
jgi:hypothetical protein